jgi:cytochrome c
MSRELGQVVASRCLGCHAFERGAPAAIAPTLYGVVGRRIASMRGFTYSDALEAKGGRWTEQSLRDFLSNPTDFAPGTSMEFPFQLTEREIDHLLTYLRSID